MIVRPYTLNDLPKIAEMLRYRNLDIALTNDLPRFGLIAVEGNNPIAFGAIREVEGDRGMLDSYITHPEATHANRDYALDRITAKLIKIARLQGLKQLIAFSIRSVVVSRAERHGFTTFPSAPLQVIDL